MDFKQDALDTFQENIKRKLPDVPEGELEIMLTAFSAGFNVGGAQNGTDFEKEVALKLLAI